MLKQTLLTLSICAVTSLAIFQTVHAQISEFKITASDPALNDIFGHSVSIFEDYAIVGAPHHAENGLSNSGAAYVYRYNGTTWDEEFKLVPSVGAVDDYFGTSVSINGEYAVVGAPNIVNNGTTPGAAYVFKRTGTSWAQEEKLFASDGVAGDVFGNSVSISGDYAIVGAFLHDDNGLSNSGSAYVFHRNGTSWPEEDELLADIADNDEYFGYSVSIFGDYAAISAPIDNENGLNSGSGYAFKRTGTSWAQEEKLLPTDGIAQDFFGQSISIFGDYVVVGAPFHDEQGVGSGSAYVFHRTGTSWLQEDELLPADGKMEDFLGWSVSISGDYAVVGAHAYKDNSADSTGSAYIFKRDGTNWDEAVQLFAFDKQEVDFFGFSVSIYNGRVIVGAIWDDDNNAEESGSAYVYSDIIVGIDDERVGLPAEYTLSQNYPNPFNPETIITYALPSPREVSLIIYDIRGRNVAQLVNGLMPAGYHSAVWDASRFSSGIYFYRIQAGDFVQTRKMVLLK